MGIAYRFVLKRLISSRTRDKIHRFETRFERGQYTLEKFYNVILQNSTEWLSMLWSMLPVNFQRKSYFEILILRHPLSLTCYLSVSSHTGPNGPGKWWMDRLRSMASDEWTDCVAWQPLRVPWFGMVSRIAYRFASNRLIRGMTWDKMHRFEHDSYGVVYFRIFLQFFFNLSRISHESLTNLSWISHESPINLPRISHESLMNLSRISHESLTNLSWISHESLMNLSRISPTFLWAIDVYNYGS